MQNNSFMIEVKNLRHYFHDSDMPAVDGVDFTVRKGEIYGLLGPNGAGKSTIVNILTTLLAPSAGEIMIAGYDCSLAPMEIRKRLGIVFQDNSLDERLTAYENFYYHAKLYHIPRAHLKERIELGLRLVNLWDRRHELVLRYSGGMKRRLELARSIIHEPSLLILDEPTIGLDPQSRRQIWEYICKLHKEQGLTVLLTTHYLEEAEICDTVAIIDQGRVIVQDNPDKLKKSLGKDMIKLQTKDNSRFCHLLQELYDIQALQQNNEIQFQVADGSRFLAELFKTSGDEIIAVNIEKFSLEELFIQLTGAAIREQESSRTDKLKGTVKSRWLH